MLSHMWVGRVRGRGSDLLTRLNLWNSVPEATIFSRLRRCARQCLEGRTRKAERQFLGSPTSRHKIYSLVVREHVVENLIYEKRTSKQSKHHRSPSPKGGERELNNANYVQPLSTCERHQSPSPEGGQRELKQGQLCTKNPATC